MSKTSTLAAPRLVPDQLIQQLSIDCVIFGYHGGQLRVLISRLAFKGTFWALPGGFIRQDEDIDRAARRILHERSGISRIFLDQYYVFGKADRRNHRFLQALLRRNRHHPLLNKGGRHLLQWLEGRFVSIGYYALVDYTKVIPRATEVDASVEWRPVDKLPRMIMDHNRQVEKALEILRLHFDQKLMWLNLLPAEFTMKELQQLYESVYGKPFPRNNFQKKILGLGILERLRKQYSGASNKAPFLYRVRKTVETRSLSGFSG